MKRAIPAVLGAAALASPFANAWAAAKRKIVTRSVTGPVADVSRWGQIEVVLVVRKTTTTAGSHAKVGRRITGVRVPLYPDHTGRSQFINSQAIPLLAQEVLQAQFDPNIQLISGATDSSYGFQQSLQAALLKAAKV